MSRQFWSETVFWGTSAGTAVANSTTETIVFPNVTLPANFMQDGRAIRVRSAGSYSTTTGSPTLAFGLRWGGVVGTLLATTPAFVTLATAQTGGAWDLDCIVQTRSNGSTGSLIVTGKVHLYTTTLPITQGSATGAPAEGFFSFAAAMPAATIVAPAAVTVDLTADTALSLTCKWGTASASNTLSGQTYSLEALN